MVSVIRVYKPRVWLLTIGAIVLLFGVKVGRPYLLPADPPLELNDQPALLFFNNEEGCECVLPLYAKADEVITAWISAERAQIPVHRLILDEQPDFQRRYAIERAPMLALLDAKGQVVWREWGVASNPDVFDLAEVERQISLLSPSNNAD